MGTAGAGKGPGGTGARRPPADPPARGKFGNLSIGQAGTLEYTTARYMPPGSPVYNGNLALFPGMTADCSIVTNRKENVLRVPSSALRFNPAAFVPMSELAPSASAQGSLVPPAQSGGQRAGAPGAAPGAPRTAPGAPGTVPGAPGTAPGGTTVVSRGVVAKSEDRVWVLADGRLKVLSVKAGISDGMYTEVSGEGITPGLAVVTGVEEFKKILTQGGAPLMGGMHH
jgi:HlyD family secretion protein